MVHLHPAKDAGVPPLGCASLGMTPLGVLAVWVDKQISTLCFSRNDTLGRCLQYGGSVRTVVFRFAVVDDLVAFGDLEEFGIGFGGRESGDGEDLFAAGGAVYLGD